MRVRRTISIWLAIIAIAIAQFGCEKKEQPRQEQAQAEDTHEHHEHKAPHGGALVGLGKEFAHVELVLEKTTGKLTGYVLDGEAEKPVRLAQKAIELKISMDAGQKSALQLMGVANTLTGETEGDTSQFAGQSDALKGVTKFHAEIASIAVKGQTFTKVAFGFPEGNEHTHDKAHTHEHKHGNEHTHGEGEHTH